MAGKNMLSFICRAGVEFSWLLAWGNFVMVALFHKPFPLAEGLYIFAPAVAVTTLHRGKGWRIVTVLLLQVLGFAFAGSRLVHSFLYPSYPYLDYAWVFECFRSSRGIPEWFFLALILFLAVLYWLAGVRFAGRSDEYFSICGRFDLGLSALFLLFLIKFISFYKEGVVIQESVSTFMVFPFFCFGLTAIGLARGRSDAKKEFLTGYRGIGMVLSFAAVVLLVGSAGVTLFLPYLTKAAEAGYTLMQKTAEPLSPILIAILRLLFVGRSLRPESPSPSSNDLHPAFAPHPQSTWWSEFLGRVLAWGFGGVLVILFAVAFGIAVWYLVRWLFSRTDRGGKRSIRGGRLLWWAARLRAFLFLLWEKITLRLTGFRKAFQLYGALLRWGRHSGLPVSSTDTPLEYGLRLARRFPPLRSEIDTIINAFNQEVYGETLLTGRQWTDARWAWRRLCSPSHWSSRLRSWFSGIE
jgi:hypothetical protein